MTTYDLSEFKNKKIALVLSGGVVKAAAWHIGVTLALEELGFSLKGNRTSNANETMPKKHSLEIGTYVGSSAGAMISIFLACGYTPQEIINGAFGLTKGEMKRLTYLDMFYLNKFKLRPKMKDLYQPLESFPKLFRNLLSPLMNFPGFFSTEGVRRSFSYFDQFFLCH